MAMYDSDLIGGALNLIGADTLYGRNWGATTHVQNLHFEACYYQAIDFAIQGVAEKQLKNIAKEHAIGGLGLYNNFMHIDSGPFRRWVS